MRPMRLLLLLSTIFPAAAFAQTANDEVVVRDPASGARDANPAASEAAAGPMGLVRAFDLSLDHDAEYRSAEAEFDVNRAAAQQSLASYLPSANYSMTNIPTDGLTRQVFSVSQPIVSLERLATLRQRGPRTRYANVVLLTRQNELAQRMMKDLFQFALKTVIIQP